MAKAPVTPPAPVSTVPPTFQKVGPSPLGQPRTTKAWRDQLNLSLLPIDSTGLLAGKPSGSLG